MAIGGWPKIIEVWLKPQISAASALRRRRGVYRQLSVFMRQSAQLTCSAPLPQIPLEPLRQATYRQATPQRCITGQRHTYSKNLYLQFTNMYSRQLSKAIKPFFSPVFSFSLMPMLIRMSFIRHTF